MRYYVRYLNQTKQQRKPRRNASPFPCAGTGAINSPLSAFLSLKFQNKDTFHQNNIFSSNQLQSKCHIIWKVIGFQLVHCPVVQREVLSQVLNQLGIVARNCFPHHETMHDADENEISYYRTRVRSLFTLVTN